MGVGVSQKTWVQSLRVAVLIISFVLACSAWTVQAQTNNLSQRRTVRGGHRPGVATLKPTGNLATGRGLKLAIALPLRNTEGLTNFLEELYNPASPNYRRFLSSQEFTERFGPTEQDYEEVKRFARDQGLVVTGTHANRTLINVQGRVSDIQRAFNVVLRTYAHPTESRSFFMADEAPQVESAVPMLEICGLDDFEMPKPLFREMPAARFKNAATPDVGSGPFGTFMGNDFRAAYVPGINLKGDGQKVGLFQLDGYYPNDPHQYAIQTGLTNSIALTTLSNILVGDFDGAPGVNNVEVALDIEMVMAMAPNSQILVYMGTNYATGAIDVLNRMASDNLAKQLSASWSYPTGPATAQVFLQMAAQGQSFFNSSGDNGAYTGEVTGPKDIPYIIIVGGTTLNTSGAGGGVGLRSGMECW